MRVKGDMAVGCIKVGFFFTGQVRGRWSRAAVSMSELRVEVVVVGSVVVMVEVKLETQTVEVNLACLFSY